MFNHYIRSKANDKIVEINEFIHDNILDSSEASNVRQKINSQLDASNDSKMNDSDDTIESDESDESVESTEEIESDKSASEKEIEENEQPEKPERTLWNAKRKHFQISNSIMDLVQAQNK